MLDNNLKYHYFRIEMDGKGKSEGCTGENCGQIKGTFEQNLRL